jgi:hypothetical protein
LRFNPAAAIIRTNLETIPSEELMKVNVKRKNYYLDERKINKAKSILKASTETQAINAALDLVVFRKEILDSLEKVAGKGGVEKIF